MGNPLPAIGAFLIAYGAQIVSVLSLAATTYMAFSAPGPPEGPRLGDVRVQTSTYGKVIPIGFGRMRMAGNIIWALELEEVKTKEAVGGKGGGKQTTYSYYAHFAVGLAEGPAVACSRIWADKKIIYDVSGDSPVHRRYKNMRITMQPGDENQLPDPLIEADMGVGQTPAYRGRVYVTLQDMPVGDFGNRIPHMEFEIQFSTPVTTTTTELPGMHDYGIGNAMEDPVSGYLYFTRRYDAFATATQYGIGYLDLFTDEVIKQTGAFPFSNEDGFGANGMQTTAILPSADGRVFVGGLDASTGAPVLVQVNPFSLNLWARWDLLQMFNLANPTLRVGQASWVQTLSTGTFNYSILFFNGEGGGSPDIDNDKWLIFNRDGIHGGIGKGAVYADLPVDVNGDKIWPSGFHLHEFDFTAGKGPIWPYASAPDDRGNLWVCGWADNAIDNAKGILGNRSGKLWRVHCTPLAGGGLDVNVTEFDLPTLDPSGRFHRPALMVFDEATRTLTLWGSQDPDGDYGVVQFDLDTRTIINSVFYQTPAGNKYQPNGWTGAGLLEGRLTAWQNGTDMNGRIYYQPVSATVDDEWVVYNAWDFSFTENQIGPYVTGAISETYWHKDTNKTYVWNGPGTDNPSNDDPVVFYRQVIVDSTETLDVIVKSLIADVRVDVTAEVDTDAAMAATIVEGFIVGTQGSVRSAINPLGFAFFFDAVESESKIAFRSRAAASIRTIPQEDLGSKPGSEGQGETDVLITNRQQETDIPSRVDLVYMDVTRNFLEGNQHAQRVENPSPTQFSNSVFQNSLPLAMHPDQVKAVAEAKLYDAWAARLTHKFQFGPKHMDLEPTDIITVGVDGHPTVLMRMSETQLGEAFVTRAEGVTHDPEVLNTVGAGALAAIEGGFLVFQGPTTAFLMDLPLLQDGDNAGDVTTGIYVGMGGMRDDWIAGVITKAKIPDTARGPFDLFETSRGETPWGYLETALAAEPDLFWTDLDMWTVSETFTRLDTVSEIRVGIIGGEDQLQSITHEEFWELGLNTAVLLDPSDASKFEIFRFQNVSITAGVATLTNLLRGLRGTEIGGRDGWGLTASVVFLDPNITTRKQLDLNEIGDPYVYGVETIREPQDTTRQIWFTAAGNDLKPYAGGYHWMTPAVGSRSASDVHVNWRRRSRVDGEIDLNTVATEIPKDTDGEPRAFEVDLIHKTTGAVSKTYTGQTHSQNGYDITVAERATAGYSNNEAITVRTYQVSDIPEVGRGFAREITG